MADNLIICGPSWMDSGWATQGLVTNPAVNDIIADTGELAEGIYTFNAMIQLAGYANIWIALEHRNAANGATLKYQSFWFGTPIGNVPMHIQEYKIEESERMRFEMLAALTGTIHASITWFKHY